MQLRHIMQLEENGAYIDFGESFDMDNAILMGLIRPFTMENDVILRTAELLFKSLAKVQEQLNAATKPGLIEQLIGQFKKNMLYVTFLMCMLYIRIIRPILPYEDEAFEEDKVRRVSTSEKDLPLIQEIFVKLRKQFPLLESPNSGYWAPLSHVIFDRSYVALWPERYQKYHHRIMQMFIDTGFDVNSVDSNNNTLLHVAASADPDCELIWLLLKHGADSHCRNNSRKTALDIVKTPFLYGRTDMVAHLLHEEMHMKIQRLACIAAIKVRDANIPYGDIEGLPESLIKFLDRH